ncbi:MAG: hypothetical protein Q9186_003822 [Xanthomendoza sp. 1 TL-2023]
MEDNISDNLLNEPSVRRIVPQCTSSNPESSANPSGPHATSTLNARLLEAMTPKKYDLQLNAFELKLETQYQEAYKILIHNGVDKVTKEQFSSLHFIIQPMDDFKTPSKIPSLYELYLAYKTCLFRAVLDPSEAQQCLHMMMLTFKCLQLKREELEKASTLKNEVMMLMDLRREILTQLGTKVRS